LWLHAHLRKRIDRAEQQHHYHHEPAQSVSFDLFHFSNPKSRRLQRGDKFLDQRVPAVEPAEHQYEAEHEKEQYEADYA